MRRVLTIGMALVLCSVMLAGPAAAQMGFGVKGGLNIADLSDLEAIDSLDQLETESKTGFVGGAYVKFPFGPFRLQIEGLYSLKGAKGSNLGTKPWETKLTYIEVPVLLKYEFPTPVLKPFLYGGASMAFLMKAEMRNEVVDSADWFDVKDGMKTTDYGLVVGAGIKLLGLTLEGRYTHGLSNTMEDDPASVLVNEAKNKTYSVMVGFDFF